MGTVMSTDVCNEWFQCSRGAHGNVSKTNLGDKK